MIKIKVCTSDVIDDISEFIGSLSIVTRNHISQYSSNHFDEALDDLTGNGYTAVDIKFDMDGDIVIFCKPVI